MNKIDPELLHQISRGIPSGSNRKKTSGPVDSQSFGEILGNQLGKKSDIPDGAAGISELGEIQGSFKTRQIELELDTALFKQELEASINQLEMYAQWLGDPDRTLKDAKSLLDRLSEQTDNLDAQLAPHIRKNNDLARILDQLKTAVAAEHIKLDRGDYL